MEKLLLAFVLLLAGSVFAETLKGFTLSGKENRIHEIKSPLGNAGTILFWARLNTEKNTPLFEALDAGGKVLLSAEVDSFGLCTNFRMKNGAMKPFRRWNRGAFSKDEWFFYAVSYDKNGLVRIMYNALPFYTPLYGSWFTQKIPNLQISGAAILRFRAGPSFDLIRTADHALHEAELTAAFRQLIPVDIVMDDIVVKPEKKAVLEFQAAPCGTFFTPNFKVSPVKENVVLRARISLLKGKEDAVLLAEQSYIFTGSGKKKYKLPAISLKKDQQARLRISVNGIPFYTKVLHSWDIADAKTAAAEDYRKGKLLFEKKLSDPNDPELICKGKTVKRKNYLQAGNAKYNCIAFKVDFTNAVRNRQPVLLEIDWPDDQARFMGLYMYRPSKAKMLRDCLQGCVTAGNQYPNSGKIQTERYLFYPLYDSYLFEARTMANGMPGAISAFRVYAIDGGLPKLKVQYPKDLPHRMFGIIDEDQTFDYLFDHSFGNRGAYSNKVELVTNILADYLDYTGQELFYYPMLRYHASQLPHTGMDIHGEFPFQPETYRYLIRALGARGRKFHAIINMFMLPEFHRYSYLKEKQMKEGLYRITPYGTAEGQNMFHPEIEKRFFAYVEDLLKKFSKDPAFEGIDYWTLSSFTARKTASLPDKYQTHFGDRGLWSYDDFNIARYRKEADSKMPDFKGDNRFLKRFEYLMQPENEPKWNNWNLKQTVKHLTRFRKLIDKYNPKLILTTPENALTKGMKIQGVRFTVKRNPTDFYWNVQYSDKFTLDDIQNFGRVDGFKKKKDVCSFYSYGETFADSPSPDYASYFQNIDMKAPGRHALRDLAYAVARHDVTRFTWGGEPLAAMGREAEVREFARAFCALPALEFNDVSGLTDPVTVRYLNTKNGTYVYCVNLMHSPCALTLKGVTAMQDLSDSKNAGPVITLKPYELRSFLIPGEVRIEGGRVEFPAEFHAFYAKKFKEAQNAVATLEKNGISGAAAASSLKMAQRLFKTGKYAEAHAQLFSPGWYRANQLMDDAEGIKIIGNMLRNRMLRVNCGSTAFTKTADGRVFVSDAAFSDGRGYGYTGKNVLYCTRNVDGLRYPHPILFMSEAYNIENYQVKLPDGLYDVKLYMRWGYEPAFKREYVQLKTKFKVGEKIVPVDFKADLKRDMRNVLIYEFKNVKVTGGLLKIEFIHEGENSTNPQLLNALEVTPAK